MLDDPKYLLGHVVSATGVSASVLKAWLSREPRVIPLGPYDQQARGKGSARLFTLRRILAVGLTAELIHLGFTASRAGLLAFSFTDWSLRDSELLNQLEGPFLSVYPDNETPWLILNYNASLRAVLKTRRAHSEPPVASVVVVNCAVVAQRILARLDLKHDEAVGPELQEVHASSTAENT
jgi:hypothetical protein